MSQTEETPPRGSRPRSHHEDDVPAYVIWQRLLDKTEQLTLQQALLQGKVEEAIKSLTVVRIVLHGDDFGKGSLLHEVADLRKTVNHYATTMDRIEKMMEGRAVEDVKGKWDLTKSMIVALVAGVLAIAGAIITALLRSGK